MWNIKYNTNELSYKTEADSQTYIENGGCQGLGDGLGVWVWNQQKQTVIYRVDKQQILLYSTYIQYLLINHNGKEYEEGMCMYN